MEALLTGGEIILERCRSYGAHHLFYSKNGSGAKQNRGTWDSTLWQFYQKNKEKSLLL